MVLHISAYSSRRFAIRARVNDDILDFSILLIASLDALGWIISVMISLMVSMSSIRVGIRSSLILFVRYILLVAYWPSVVFPSTSKSDLMLLITIIW